MTIKKIILFLPLCLVQFVSAQDIYGRYKSQYDRLRKEKKHDSALIIARQMNVWSLENETDTSLRYALSLRYVGNCYRSVENNDSAIHFYKKSLGVLEKQNRTVHNDYASALNNVGVIYSEQKDYKSAEIYFIKALKVRETFMAEELMDYGSSLTSLGILYSDMGQIRLSISYFMQALEVERKTIGEHHPDYAESMQTIGELYMKLGDYKAADSFYKTSLEVYEHSLGLKHPKFAGVLNSRGNLYSAMGDYKSAEQYFKQALEIIKLKFGELHPNYAGILNNLGGLYLDIGNLKMAELSYKQALDIRKKVLGEETLGTAASINSLANLFLQLNDYKSAEFYFKKSLSIYKKILGDQHSNYAMVLNNLGNLFSEIGNFTSAELYYKESLEVTKKSLGELHPDYARSLDNLALVYTDLKNYNLALQLHKQASEIRKNHYGLNHPIYAMSLNNLGNFYIHTGDLKLSLLFHEQATEIRKISFGEQHPEYAESLNNLAIIYSLLKEYVLAEPYYHKALETARILFNEEHTRYYSLENAYAYLLLRTNRMQEGYNVLNKNYLKITKAILENFEWLNESQKEAYWKKESAFYDNLSFFANNAYEQVPEAVGLNYNAVLVTKSKMLEAKISSENYYREVDELREELAYRRRLLIKLESDGSTERSKLEKLRHEADSLDKRLTLSWPEYAEQKKNLSITWDQVQQNLDNSEAAIEFVRFENEGDSLYYYNALVLKKGDLFPSLIKLCREKDLQSLNPQMGYSAYYPLIWKPLDAVLKDVKTIYYAPTGELYNIPFHAIYEARDGGDQIIAAKTDKRGIIIENERTSTEQNAVYLMDRYTMHQLTSTRYLAMGLKQKAKEPIANSIVMVGGVNYDYLPGTIASTENIPKGKNPNRSSSSVSGKLIYLEGTKAEADQINQQVTSANWQTRLLEDTEAKEENIIKLEGKEAKGILHLATHGYAFPEFNFNDTTISKNSLRYSYRFSTNPMVRSGLILAGGNWAWTGSDTLTKLGAEQNGILTALEVSQLNLKKTKLVVLSACETGLGKIEGSEGTFGLKRGFKLAGVEQMIVSLWSVPDKETMELMTLFYTDLSKSLHPVASFEKAQKEMRNKYPTAPEKWAGFILVR
ncbi:MAG: CHAT domain-containing protein [Chitinophagia bacterium]|jgi:CHAT domain-containing protein/Tfp pilus assembly protein PilF